MKVPTPGVRLRSLFEVSIVCMLVCAGGQGCSGRRGAAGRGCGQGVRGGAEHQAGAAESAGAGASCATRSCSPTLFLFFLFFHFFSFVCCFPCSLGVRWRSQHAVRADPRRGSGHVQLARSAHRYRGQEDAGAENTLVLPCEREPQRLLCCRSMGRTITRPSSISTNILRFASSFVAQDLIFCSHAVGLYSMRDSRRRARRRWPILWKRQTLWSRQRVCTCLQAKRRRLASANSTCSSKVRYCLCCFESRTVLIALYRHFANGGAASARRTHPHPGGDGGERPSRRRHARLAALQRRLIRRSFIVVLRALVGFLLRMPVRCCNSCVACS